MIDILPAMLLVAFVFVKITALLAAILLPGAAALLSVTLLLPALKGAKVQVIRAM